MHTRHDFRNGQRHLFIEGKTEDEREFLTNFFNSPRNITLSLTADNNEEITELKLSKGM